MGAPITINSNIASLQSQRSLGQATTTLRQVFERLSSGQRINRASDDAAGLAISANLQIDTRVINQASRNLNDGLNLLAVSESALGELGLIAIRLNELAEQAANGTLGYKQRQSLDLEAQQLSREYNRIIASTEYANIRPLDGSATTVALQAGYGSANTRIIELFPSGGPTSVEHFAGTGTFQNAVSYNSEPGGQNVHIKIGDLNNDGTYDLILSDFLNSDIVVMLGNGNGSFKAQQNYSTTTLIGYGAFSLGDFNKDGVTDIVSSNNWGSGADIFLGNGDGTFKGPMFFAIPEPNPGTSVTADFNQDGNLDFALSAANSSDFRIFLNNGNGTFKPSVSWSMLPGNNLEGFVAADFNNDGKTDVASGNDGTANVAVRLGNGDGTFKAAAVYTAGVGPDSLVAGDLNDDGILDIVTGDEDDSKISVLLGNGDGSFKARISYATGGGVTVPSLADLNGDNILDAVTANGGSNTVGILIGNGDGSFKAPSLFSMATGNAGGTVAVGDFNGDGVADIAAPSYDTTTVSILIGNGQLTAYVIQGGPEAIELPTIDLTSRITAKECLDDMVPVLIAVNLARGGLGAQQSRLDSALKNLAITNENYRTAASGILDADVASEAAALARGRILQNAASAVLASANNQPALAITLLTSL